MEELITAALFVAMFVIIKEVEGVVEVVVGKRAVGRRMTEVGPSTRTADMEDT